MALPHSPARPVPTAASTPAATASPLLPAPLLPPHIYTVETVLHAVHALYGNAAQDNAARRDADGWLRDFQKTVRHDLDQLDPHQRLQLRDSLISSLLRFRVGPRTVSVHLCMAIARLAILLPDWESPLQQLFNMFREPADVRLRLNIVSALPDEFEEDRHITLTKDEFLARKRTLVTMNADSVLQMLLVILNSDVDDEIADQTLDCLYAWMRTGDIGVLSLASTHLVERVAFIMQSSQSNDTFEHASTLLSEIIIRSGRLLRRSRTKSEDSTLCLTIIQSVYHALQPMVGPLQAAVQSASEGKDDDNEEKIRELCNLFACAGEEYLPLIIDNLAAWKGVVDGLLACASCNDLEIVPNTFQFWTMLSEELTSNRMDALPQFLDIYRLLIDIMIRHLHYPLDMSWTPKDRDEFREFRHSVGAVLKGCVDVLGEEEALMRPYKALTGFIVAGSGPGGALDPSVPWQSVEAPLFALRTMGRKVDETESKMLPGIMEMLPQLPAHPKVRYSAILVIGRYASWTRRHPEHIPNQMNFIATGFEDQESVAAACLALKYLCEECGAVMVDYLVQLHPFYLSAAPSMGRYERLDLLKALASVIRHVPLSAAANATNMQKVLEMFCLPMAERLHQIATAGRTAFDDNIAVEAAGLLEQLSALLYECRPANIPAGAADPCVAVFQGVWPVLSGLLDLEDGKVHQGVCRLLVDMLAAHTDGFAATVPDVLPKLVASYAASRLTPLLWAASRYIRRYGRRDGANGQAAGVMRQVVETMSATAFACVQEAAASGPGGVNRISDVIEDYFSLLSELVLECPTQFLQSPLLPSFLQCAVACMPVEECCAWTSLYVDFLLPALSLLSPSDERSSAGGRGGARTMPPLPAPMLAPLVEAARAARASLLAGFLRGLVVSFPSAGDVRGLRQDCGPAVFGALFVAVWDAALAGAPLAGDGAGHTAVAAAAAAELAAIVADCVNRLEVGVPVFKSDADKQTFLESLA
ncbi:Nuclear import receptor, partial [Cladochytrium tenue]